MTNAELVFNTRIISMMRDYQCTMREALEWDFESFEFDIRRMDEDLLKDEFNFYLSKNGIDVKGELASICVNVIMGQQDYGLRKLRMN